MSECVVRMEMPTSCEKCPACDYEEGNCLLADDRNTLPHNGKRRPWCPILCSLPEGHGRLVDADAMTDDVRSLWDYKTVDGITASTVLKQIMTDIGNCPTIVPAAERRE